MDLCDLTNYQHPPCMFVLWYAVLFVQQGIPYMKELLCSSSNASSGGAAAPPEAPPETEPADQGDGEVAAEE